MTFNLLFLRCSFKYLQTGLSHDEAALFMTVKKGQSPFLTPNGSPLGGRRRKKRAKLALPPAGGKLCEAFFDKLRAVS